MRKPVHHVANLKTFQLAGRSVDKLRLEVLGSNQWLDLSLKDVEVTKNGLAWVRLPPDLVGKMIPELQDMLRLSRLKADPSSLLRKSV